MSFRVDTIAPFRKEAKKLIRRYPSLKTELAELGNQLSQNPTLGTSLGNNCYKIRLSIKSKATGKSGGARIITHVVHVTDRVVYLLSIYDKSAKETITKNELQELLKFIQ